MKPSNYRLSLSIEELIFLAKVLDQRRFFLKAVFQKEINKDHASVKRKILKLISINGDASYLDITRREAVFIKNALSQYFIAIIRSNLIESEKTHMQLLIEVAHLLDEEINDIFKEL